MPSMALLGAKWNYLRVRGEYILDMTCGARLMELPPRTRRILSDAAVVAAHHGTTSAYAENTFLWSFVAFVRRNYLRVRGEYPCYHRKRSQT